MRIYSPRGMDRYRYMEIYYRVRRFYNLPPKEQQKISMAMEEIAPGKTGKKILAAIVAGTPYKSVDVPYSEREYCRIKRRFFEKLDKVMR